MNWTSPHPLPTLETTEELFWKVEREFYRTVHTSNFVHKADHFYNFCVTAHALREYYLKETNEWGINARRKERENQWDRVDVLCAVRDVANLAKHWRLDIRPRDGGKVERMRRDTSGMVDVYASRDGRLTFDERSVPTLILTTESGGEYDALKLAHDVVNFWRDFISSEGQISLGRQPWEKLSGGRGDANTER